MTQNPHWNEGCKTPSSKNTKQRVIWPENIYIEVDRNQLTSKSTDGVCKEICDQFIAARNLKAIWWTKAVVSIVSEFKHHDDVSCEIFTDKLHDAYPQEWTRKALDTVDDAIEMYVVEVIAKYHM
jgi:hypothetical protein